MRVEGRTTDEICSALEIKPRTLYLWFSDPLVKAELRAQLETVNEIFAEKLAETAVQGLTALAEAATAPVDEPLDWATKLEAIRLIVERAIPPLRIAYDKSERRVELTATVSEAVADAFENAEALLAEGSGVVVRDIAGARFVPRYHPRIVDRVRLAA
jgi:hypothetical protein